MPDSRDFDVTWLSNLRLPYDVVTKELSDQTPRLVAGSQNIFVTLGGKIALAPGFNLTPNGKNLSGLALANTTYRPDRIVLYETLENPPKIYIVCSLYNISLAVWQAWYYRIDAAAPAWTQIDGGANYRTVQQSTRPHEIVCERGLCWIKGFPAAAGDKYGSVIFDGSFPNPGSNSAPSIYPWGIPAPTVPINMTASGGWIASTDAMKVVFGWTYVYCWKDLLGSYSCHSPVSLVSGISLSTTGPFSNKCPAMTVQGNADTVNYPKIGIFRSTDGGGTYWWVEDITNTGAGNITYTDKNGVNGRSDPMADSQLNTANAAPDLVTNLPPPPIQGKPGEVTGTSQVDPSTSIGVFARRLWYGSGNRLYFSGQEEVLNGVPEECWPNCNGIGPSTEYICAGQVRQIIPAKATLWVTTANEILYETGTDLSNFLLNLAASDISGLAGNNMAGTGFRETGYFVSQDFQVYALVPGAEPQSISVPLGNSISQAYLACTTPQIQLDAYNRDGNTWLFVNVIDQANSANCRQFVYDINNNMWFAPWTKALGVCAYGRLRDNDPLNYLVGFINYNGNWQIGVLDTTVFNDIGTINPITPTIQTNLFGINAGWGGHESVINAPAVTPVISYMVTERTKFASDTDPTVSYRLDEFNTVAFTSVPAQGPLFEVQHTSYWQELYPIQQVCRRVQINITKPAVNEGFEYQNIGFVFDASAGA
jgi:hypothetical protein